MTKTERQTLWTTRITEFKASGQNVPTWCADNNIRPYQLWYWLRKEKLATIDTTLAWLPVDLSNTEFQDSLLVRVGQVVVKVKSGFDPKLLLDVVNTLTGR